MSTALRAWLAVIGCSAAALVAVAVATAPAHATVTTVPLGAVAAEPPPTPSSSPPAPSASPTSPSPSTPGSPNPSTSAPGNPSSSPGVPTSPEQDSGGCGWFDVACKAKQAINNWFKDLVSSAINPVFGFLGSSLLTTPRLDQTSRVQGLWTGSLVVANSCYVLLVLAGGLTLMGRQTLQNSYAVKDIAPRLVVGMVASNTSLILIGQSIEFANALSAALMGQGVDPQQTADQLQKIIVHALNPGDVGMFIVLVTIWAVLLGVILLLIYITRVMLTILLIAAAPLALACHALPQTEGLAKLWWRCFFGVLAIQVAQALVFIAAMRVVLTTDMVTILGFRTPGDQVDLWTTICLLYVLVRIPSWISRLIWQGGVISRSPITRTAKMIVSFFLFRGLLGRLAGARGSAGRTPPPPPPAGRFTGPSVPALPPGPKTPPPAGPGEMAQPRWGPAHGRWMPPDPAWHERVHDGRPAPGSVGEQQRWGRPETTWTPPHAGDWRAPPPQPRRPPPQAPYQPDPHRPWKRPS
ncbi:hypothetical protein E1264_20705 [Actinomadura sp. KC216]|uniref:hypothetical protein n=1 Tax=Actinomadura sp. KC216 TaxID=2530370 RepID=UPI00104CBF93|nr:hypothetical protein [Actinomadura sp. KC216]TDB85606.1 hypothetical protein E1264_20705 [Actinomadura sp. KC216]